MKPNRKSRRRKAFPLQVIAQETRVNAEVAGMAALRQNLMLKAGHNESTVDRLVDLERERLPDASLQSLMEAAIERWERENR